MLKTNMIIIEGKSFNHTFSDSGFMIERNGLTYIDALDPIDLNRKYTETNIKINDEINYEVNDYKTALQILMGERDGDL